MSFYLLLLLNTADYKGKTEFDFYEICQLSRSRHVIFLHRLTHGLPNFGRFLTSKKGVDLYAEDLCASIYGDCSYIQYLVFYKHRPSWSCCNRSWRKLRRRGWSSSWRLIALKQKYVQQRYSSVAWNMFDLRWYYHLTNVCRVWLLLGLGGITTHVIIWLFVLLQHYSNYWSFLIIPVWKINLCCVCIRKQYLFQYTWYEVKMLHFTVYDSAWYGTCTPLCKCVWIDWIQLHVFNCTLMWPFLTHCQKVQVTILQLEHGWWPWAHMWKYH